MKNFQFQHNGKTYWYSRSVGSGIFVFTEDEGGRLCVLANKRGVNAPNHNGEWNCPGGYLDFDETTKECAVRECFEETGIKIADLDNVRLFGIQDSPTAENQNVMFRYTTFIEGGTEMNFDLSNSEKGEVAAIGWIPVDEIGVYKWAFGHDRIIKEIVNDRAFE